MAVVTVRLSEKEKATLEKYGKISDVVRDAIRLYINNKKTRDALKRLEEYQKKNPVTTTTEEIVAMIREDRESSSH
jgi:Arc/MetJ-type ribon-helix-helix transcriptional regulator